MKKTHYIHEEGAKLTACFLKTVSEKIKLTTDKSKVTCKNCLNRLENVAESTKKADNKTEKKKDKRMDIESFSLLNGFARALIMNDLLMIARNKLKEKQIVLNEETKENSVKFCPKPPAKNDPIIIKIKNNTLDRLFDVKLMEVDFEKMEKKISYSMGIVGLSYKEFIFMMTTQTLEVDSIQIRAKHDYQKYQNKQLLTPLNATNKDVFGRRHTQYMYPSMNPLQEDKGISVINGRNSNLPKNLKISCPDQNIIISELLPETEVIISLYPKTQ